MRPQTSSQEPRPPPTSSPARLQSDSSLKHPVRKPCGNTRDRSRCWSVIGITIESASAVVLDSGLVIWTTNSRVEGGNRLFVMRTERGRSKSAAQLDSGRTRGLAASTHQTDWGTLRAQRGCGEFRPQLQNLLAMREVDCLFSRAYYFSNVRTYSIAALI